MNWPFRPSRLVLACTLVLILVGCADAITVYPIFDDSIDAPQVPDVTGRWRDTDVGGETETLEVSGDAAARSPCRKLAVRAKVDGDWVDAADEVCFLELDGYLVAELHSVPPIADFYRQYLVRVANERLEVCAGLPVWVVLDMLARDHPVGFSLEALAHTKRESNYFSQIVLIAKPAEMRAFLVGALPEVAAACDTGTGEIRWGRLERMSERDVGQTERAPAGLLDLE